MDNWVAFWVLLLLEKESKGEKARGRKEGVHHTCGLDVDDIGEREDPEDQKDDPDNDQTVLQKYVFNWTN